MAATAAQHQVLQQHVSRLEAERDPALPLLCSILSDLRCDPPGGSTARGALGEVKGGGGNFPWCLRSP